MSHDHFAKNRKLAIDQLVAGLKKEIKQQHFSHSYEIFLTLHAWNDRPLHFKKKL